MCIRIQMNQLQLEGKSINKLLWKEQGTLSILFWPMKIIKNEAAAKLPSPLEVKSGQPPCLKHAWEMAPKRHISEL